jgi:hypothetical protein
MIKNDLHARLMDSIPEKITEGHKIRVVLEPDLQEQAELLTAPQRRALAKIYRRWARQLEVSAKIMDADDQTPKRDPLKPLPKRRLTLN